MDLRGGTYRIWAVLRSGKNAQSHSVEPKTVVIIGANGFIGRHLSKGLVSAGYNVTGVSKSRPESVEFTDFLEGYNYELCAFDDVIAKSQVVIFSAGKLRPSSPFDFEVVSSEAGNVLGIARKCAEFGVEKFVMTSSGGTIYGHPDVVPVSEKMPARPINAYGYMHSIVENGLRVISNQSELKTVSLRVGNVYGPGQTSRLGQGLIPVIFEKVRTSQKLDIRGDGTEMRDYIFIHDLVDCYAKVIENTPSYMCYNVGSEVGVSINGVVAQIEQVLGKTVERQFTEIIHGAPGFDVILDCSRARYDLGWKPQYSFEQGLKTYLGHIEDNPQGQGLSV